MTKTFGDLKVGDKVYALTHQSDSVFVPEITNIDRNANPRGLNITLGGSLVFWAFEHNTFSVGKDDTFFSDKRVMVDCMKNRRNTLNSLIEDYENRSL